LAGHTPAGPTPSQPWQYTKDRLDAEISEEEPPDEDEIVRRYFGEFAKAFGLSEVR
jgi:hypothetical protein